MVNSALSKEAKTSTDQNAQPIQTGAILLQIKHFRFFLNKETTAFKNISSRHVQLLNHHVSRVINILRIFLLKRVTVLISKAFEGTQGMFFPFKSSWWPSSSTYQVLYFISFSHYIFTGKGANEKENETLKQI